jgi:hypothetical protein
MRKEVREFAALGSLPDQNAEPEVIDQHAASLEQIEQPVSDEEARILVGLFGPDDCYGVAWTLLHLIETAPNWPLKDVLQEEKDENEWVRRLRKRAEREDLT